jgi:sugar/nucleoside kinase (ribokinase family)
MQTFLGASATLGPDDVDEELVRGAEVAYLEGYLWDPPPAKEAFLEAARIAHAAGRRVALSLSDRFCVERHRGEFRDLVEHHADILFANEEEICALYEAASLREALRELGGGCAVAAVTRGARGSIVRSRGETIEVPAVPVTAVVDTTGAGDLYAAGFLFGLTRGNDLARCARIGSLAAAEVVSHFGARPERPLVDLVDAAVDRDER